MSRCERASRATTFLAAPSVTPTVSPTTMSGSVFRSARTPKRLVSADAATARWELDVTVVVGPDDNLDFKGPAAHGERGDRFLYLTWGNIDDNGDSDMFRRAKLMLNRIDPVRGTR